MDVLKLFDELHTYSPYIQSLSDVTTDKRDLEEKLSALNRSEIIVLVTIMEVGREYCLMDDYRPKASPWSVYTRRKKTAIHLHENKSKEELVDYLLNKLLLHRYMEVAVNVLALNKKDKWCQPITG